MAAEKLTEMQDEQLLAELSRCKHELFEARFKLATGQLEDHASISGWKRQIARILTELREREIAAAEAVAGGSA